MMTFHDWLTLRTEGMWLNDKRAEPGMSNINPLEQEKAKSKKRKQTALPTAKAVKPALPARVKRKALGVTD